MPNNILKNLILCENEKLLVNRVSTRNNKKFQFDLILGIGKLFVIRSCKTLLQLTIDMPINNKITCR